MHRLPAPVLPGRLFPPKGVVGCLRASLDRLGVESVELYQVHGYIHQWYKSIESVAKDLAECVKLGLCKTVGVSNYSKDQMVRMYEALKKQGVPRESAHSAYSLCLCSSLTLPLRRSKSPQIRSSTVCSDGQRGLRMLNARG